MIAPLKSETEALLLELREKIDSLLSEYGQQIAASEESIVSMNAGVSIDTYNAEKYLPYAYNRIEINHIEMRNRERPTVYNVHNVPDEKSVALRNGTIEVENAVADTMFKLRDLDGKPRYLTYEVVFYTLDLERLDQGVYPFIYDETLSGSDDTLWGDVDLPPANEIWEKIYVVTPEWVDPKTYAEYHPNTDEPLTTD